MMYPKKRHPLRQTTPRAVGTEKQVHLHSVDFEDDDSYEIKVTSYHDEFTSLLGSGFEYITDYGNTKVLR